MFGKRSSNGWMKRIHIYLYYAGWIALLICYLLLIWFHAQRTFPFVSHSPKQLESYVLPYKWCCRHLIQLLNNSKYFLSNPLKHPWCWFSTTQHKSAKPSLTNQNLIEKEIEVIIREFEELMWIDYCGKPVIFSFTHLISYFVHN